MIDRVGSENNLISALNSTHITDDNELLAFREMLSEKTQTRQVTRHGYVGDGQDLGFDIDPELLDRLSALGSYDKNIWEIILTLEEKADIRSIAEKLGGDLDDTADMNVVASLLALFRKKKELLEDKRAEVAIERGAYADKNRFDREAASAELDKLIAKKEEQKAVAVI